MKITNVVLLGVCLVLTACSTMQMGGSNTPAGENTLGAGTVPGVAIGGSIASSMDAFDRVKLNRALDKAPGTATYWANANTGRHYTVTPTQKVTVNGNPLCRQYQVIAVRGQNTQQISGTACVASDGAWSEVN